MSLGSLTTLFTPPADCINQDVAVARFSTAEDYNYYLTAGPGHSSCFPSSRFPAFSDYYSPGLCPSGYSAACYSTSVYSFGSVTETTVNCCPILSFSFKCNTDAVGADWGIFADCTAATSIVTLVPAVTSAIPSSKLSGISHDASGNALLTGPIINGYGIQVRWQQTDEALLFRTTSTSSAAIPSATSVSPAPTATALSAGAIAGACVGAIIAIAIIAGVAARIIWLKRRRKGQSGGGLYSGNDHDVPGGYGPPQNTTGEPRMPEARGVFVKHELPVPAPSGIIPKHELPGDATREPPLRLQETAEVAYPRHPPVELAG